MANISSGRPRWPPPVHAPARPVAQRQANALPGLQGIAAMVRPLTRAAAPPAYSPKPTAPAIQPKAHFPQNAPQGPRSKLLRPKSSADAGPRHRPGPPPVYQPQQTMLLIQPKGQAGTPPVYQPGGAASRPFAGWRPASGPHVYWSNAQRASLSHMNKLPVQTKPVLQSGPLKFGADAARGSIPAWPSQSRAVARRGRGAVGPAVAPAIQMDRKPESKWSEEERSQNTYLRNQLLVGLNENDPLNPVVNEAAAEVWIPGHRDGDSEMIVMGVPK